MRIRMRLLAQGMPLHARVTVPTLTDTEQPAAETTAMIGSFTVANIKVNNKYNRAVAEQLAG
jgi:hypothetical protein